MWDDLKNFVEARGTKPFTSWTYYNNLPTKYDEFN